MIKLVLIRHGESLWNLQNRFTGWTDVDLDDEGKYEALHAGHILRKEGFSFDVVYTSVLKRAIHTSWHIMDVLNEAWVPFRKDWRLNERHYGTLQGLNKKEMAEKHGDKQVHIWRRSFDVRPHPLSETDERHPRFEKRYFVLDAKTPAHESLSDTVLRVVDCWHDRIAPDLRRGKSILISAHGNSLRALVKFLDKVSDNEIPSLNIPTGVPLVYELDDNLQPLKRYYLGDNGHIKMQLGRTNLGKK